MTPETETIESLIASIRAKLAAGQPVFAVPIGRAATSVGASRITLYRWAVAGRIPGARLHGRARPRWRIPFEWVRATQLAYEQGRSAPLDAPRPPEGSTEPAGEPLAS